MITVGQQAESPGKLHASLSALMYQLAKQIVREHPILAGNLIVAAGRAYKRETAEGG